MRDMRCRMELHQSERDDFRAVPAGGKERVSLIKRAQTIYLAADRGASDA